MWSGQWATFARISLNKSKDVNNCIKFRFKKKIIAVYTCKGIFSRKQTQCNHSNNTYSESCPDCICGNWLPSNLTVHLNITHGRELRQQCMLEIANCAAQQCAAG